MVYKEYVYTETDTETIKSCEHCGKQYRQRTEDQEVGCKSKDYDTCPYCKGCNGSSMSVEFYNKRLE